MLCKDDVSIVRKSAAKNIYNLFMKMHESGNALYKESVIENVKGFYNST